MTPLREHMYAGGRWLPASGPVLTVVSPLTEEPVARVVSAAVADVELAVAAARAALDAGEWPTLRPPDRARLLRSLARAAERRRDEIAETLTSEVGSPIVSVSGFQADSAPATLREYADLAERYPFEAEYEGLSAPFVVRKVPVGVCALVIPWNVPFFLAVTKLAPALAAGCTVVLKAPPDTPLNSLLLAELVEEAGFPAGAVNVLVGDSESSEALVAHPLVDKVSFTGSTATGRRIAQICGDAVRRLSLELGGKSAAILLDDADLDTAVPKLVQAGLMNSGQMCVAQSRVLVSRRRQGEVVERLAAEVAAVEVGDPSDPRVTVGPLVTSRQRDRVERYVEWGRSDGAKVVVGGGRPSAMKRGWFVEPTLLADVDNRTRVGREEIFGPVLSVIAYRDVAHAVALANDSPYGLSGSVWTEDEEAGTAVARRMRTGTVSVGEYGLDPRAPFGGFKQSGIGREWGVDGLESFLEVQSVHFPRRAAR